MYVSLIHSVRLRFHQFCLLRVSLNFMDFICTFSAGEMRFVSTPGCYFLRNLMRLKKRGLFFGYTK